MNEIKTSALLSELMVMAKKIGSSSNPPFTAERFVVALIEIIHNGTEAIASAELKMAERLATNALIDLTLAQNELIEYINQGKSVSFLDDLYMKKKLQEASAMATNAGADEVDTVALFMCITKDPSEGLKLVMQATAEHTDTAQQVLEELENRIAQLTEEPEPIQPEANDTKAEMAELVDEVKRVRERLHSCIYGQDNAINVFTTGYFQASMLSMLDKSRRRPRATFLFAGPPGVGKTFLAEKAAQALELPFMRFDMSEYADKEANIEFCGSDRVYKNAKAGNVTSFVADHPQCVLLFDEIEKAHMNVIHLFLQMLDAGRLRDNYTDEEVSFTDAIIILTTNAGKQLYQQSESGDFSAVSRRVIVKALQNDINPVTEAPYFPGAICSRFASGNVVMFNRMGAHNLRTIAQREIQRHASNLEKETGICMKIDPGVYTALLLAEGSAADARTIRGRAESFFNDELYELLRLVSSEKGKSSITDIETIQIGVDLSHADGQILELFRPAQKPVVLVFADDETAALCRQKAPNLEIIGAQTVAVAVDTLKNRDVGFAILDMRCGVPSGSSARLNIEDVESDARELFKFLREQKAELPVYLIENRAGMLTEEEKVSFARQGVRGVLQANKTLAAQLEHICEVLHQQASMVKLAKGNKLITFSTAQTLSRNGKTADIKLFDFELDVAVDSEDAGNVLNAVSKPNVRFDQVIGAEDAKQELTYFVEYLKNPKKYMGTGVKAPKGILLYGPPGTGKTLLAKAMACEADVTFIAAEGNQFLKRYVGEGSEKVHELFRTARKYAPSILFIDEIDAIAKERRGGANSGAGGEETLTAFLTEMDGFVSDPSKPVFVLAATNFNVEPGTDKSLDPALMRRFDRRVYIDLPNKEERIRFLNMKRSANPALVISDEKLENISVRATGMSLAQLDSAVELALRSAIRKGSTQVTDEIFEEAFETFNSGEVKKWDESQLLRVARHEAGHAMLCMLGGETPSYLTIVARGDHGGYMQHAEQEGKAIYTRQELLARIRTSLGGRAAEIVYYGQEDGISTGASGDLLSATNLARQLLCSYGMDASFGLAVEVGNGPMSNEVRTAVNRILQEQMSETIRLVQENRDQIDALVTELMEKNHLSAAQIRWAIEKNQEREASKKAGTA